MERSEIVQKALCIKNLAAELRGAAEAEPYLKANADSIFAHARLICNELGLDVKSASDASAE